MVSSCLVGTGEATAASAGSKPSHAYRAMTVSSRSSSSTTSECAAEGRGTRCRSAAAIRWPAIVRKSLAWASSPHARSWWILLAAEAASWQARRSSDATATMAAWARRVARMTADAAIESATSCGSAPGAGGLGRWPLTRAGSAFAVRTASRPSAAATAADMKAAKGQATGLRTGGRAAGSPRRSRTHRRAPAAGRRPG
jgi:hypothetical protein